MPSARSTILNDKWEWEQFCARFSNYHIGCVNIFKFYLKIELLLLIRQPFDEFALHSAMGVLRTKKTLNMLGNCGAIGACSVEPWTGEFMLCEDWIYTTHTHTHYISCGAGRIISIYNYFYVCRSDQQSAVRVSTAFKSMAIPNQQYRPHASITTSKFDDGNK